ncbi:nuclear transport factor 2 family protein [Parvularcula flava]|uniref:Nuclear transport factor 2 family protein n=1 Tax=Aquisalinus luteolus TaxID=1566827 RepID=A0A8J3EQA7_9PROT|nr:nuclear transport factor 2 family protein [Aquisalinus luteolus]NHK27006.1 nuclear transport factor 2 family protein [Aquisalinus luteolus]GGH94079.1 hypothetical protein GCM10011355_07420 [Aquisalinus luteolus]
MTDLHDSIRQYFEATNKRDFNAAITAFTPDAIVRDEGNTYNGLPEIRAWMEGAAKQYSTTAEVLSSSEISDRPTVKARVTGTFPGSPITLSFFFVLSDEKINTLEIKV